MIELDLTPPQKMVRLLMGFISARAIYTGTKLDLADSVSGILLERAPAIEAARSGQGGPLPGCELIEGDYFEACLPMSISTSSSVFSSITATTTSCEFCAIAFRQ